METHVGRDELMRILRIGHDASMRGEGISLHEAIRRSEYSELRPKFGATDLMPLIRDHPELIAQWIMYSEDKRTDGGFALTGDSAEEVADFVIRELDFWATMQ
jgi:hypothetical protein